MPLGMEVGLGSGHIALHENPAPPPLKEGTAPQFSAHVCCGQTAGWIKMPLGTMVGLGPGNIVRCRPSFTPKGHRPQGAQPPSNFGPCLLWPNGWMDQDATWYEGSSWPRPHCVTWDPAPPPKRGTSRNFRPISIVAKRSPISATAEHLLSYCVVLTSS